MKTEVVLIPRDYEEGRSKGVIPICVALSDEDGPVSDKQGRLLDPEWVVAVVEPICCQMVRVARYYLGDAWRVSELADRVIHGAWRRNGPECGEYPSQKILGTAVWIARSIRAGDDLRRKKPGLFLAIDMMESKVRDQLLIDPRNYMAEVEQQLILEGIEATLRSGSESSEFAETYAKVFGSGANSSQERM